MPSAMEILRLFSLEIQDKKPLYEKGIFFVILFCRQDVNTCVKAEKNWLMRSRNHKTIKTKLLIYLLKPQMFIYCTL